MGSIRARSFTEYLQMIWRRRLVLLLVTSAMFIAAFIVINRLPDIYEARASVVVTGKHDDRQAIADRVAAVRERLTSRQFLESVAQRHTIPAGATRGGTIEAAVGRMRRDIKLDTQMRGDFPEMLSIKYRNSDPQVANDVATDLVSIFGNMNEAVEKQMADEAAALDAELNQIEGRLDQLSMKRASARGAGSGRPRVDFNALRAERTAAASSIDTLTDKQFALEREIAEQKRQIADQQKIVKSAPSEARSNSSYGVLLVRKAELEAQLKDYATQYTEKNPKVTQAQTQLAEINRQIAQLSAGEQGGPANSAEARELRTLQRELSRMETELQVTQRELERKKQALASTPSAAAIPVGAPVAATSAGPGDLTPAPGSEYDRLKDRYEAILKRQESLQYARTTAAGLDPGLFQIVEMPVVPQAPVGPDRLKLTLLALVLSLAVGLAVAVAFEIPGLFSIRDDRDVEYYLGAPVIVLIPETLTPSEQGRTRRLLLTRALGLLLLAAILVPALVLLLNNLRVFHVLAGR
ncbi:MAG: Wzz/FepE/Etk N-terminal domain-containing protein [Blastocatellia bacterium]